MRARSLLAGITLALAAGPVVARQAQPAPSVSAPALPSSAMSDAAARQFLPNTQALYDGYVAQGKLPGIVGAFGVGEFPTLFVSAGHISDDPGAAVAGPDSLWRVYSMTKPVTALAAMILIDQGKLKLDEPLSDIFPAYAHMRVLTDPDHSLASRPATRPITIRSLLTHTAGLGYGIVTKGPLLHDYERLGILPYESDARTEAQMRPVRAPSLQAFAERTATLPLIAEPGTKWSYSIGLDVMGAVIEKVSGEPFDAFVQRHIFKPLGMRSSYWQVPADQAARLATNYVFIGDKRVPLDAGATSVFLAKPTFPYGGAGLVMSARDYDRFLHLLQEDGTLDGVRIIRPETAELMMSNLLPPGVSFPAAAALGGKVPADAVGFGAGGFVLLADTPAGAKKGTYGWSGAAGTQAWVDRARRFRATIMVNYMPPDRYPVRDDTARALLQDMARLR